MALFRCGTHTRPAAPRGHGAAPPRPERGGPEPMYPGVRENPRPVRDPIRTGREALLATLERPLGTPATRRLDPIEAPAASVASAAASGEVPRRRGGRANMYDDDRDGALDVPAVPSP